MNIIFDIKLVLFFQGRSDIQLKNDFYFWFCAPKIPNDQGRIQSNISRICSTFLFWNILYNPSLNLDLKSKLCTCWISLVSTVFFFYFNFRSPKTCQIPEWYQQFLHFNIPPKYDQNKIKIFQPRGSSKSDPSLLGADRTRKAPARFSHLSSLIKRGNPPPSFDFHFVQLP